MSRSSSAAALVALIYTDDGSLGWLVSGLSSDPRLLLIDDFLAARNGDGCTSEKKTSREIFSVRLTLV